MALGALRERYGRYETTIRQVSAEKVRNRFTYLDRLFGFLGPPNSAADLFSRLDRPTIAAFLRDYARRHGPGSRRDMHAALRAFLRFGYAEQFLAQDLSALVPTVRNRAATRLPKALPEPGIEMLEGSIERNDPEGRRDAAIVCLLRTYGVRGAQIRRLRLDDIDWDQERIRFAACKGGRPVEVPLTAAAGNRLADYLANGRPNSPLREVFLTLSADRPLSHSRELSRIISRRLQQAAVSVPEGVSRGTHGFRHAFATRLVGRIPFKDLADLLGHRQPSSTLLYAKVDVHCLQQAALPWPGAQA
jgi:integrase